MKFPDGYIFEFDYEYKTTEVIVTPHTKELIRCENCKYFETYNGRKDGYCNIHRMTSDGFSYVNCEPYYYCNFAVKKEEYND